MPKHSSVIAISGQTGAISIMAAAGLVAVLAAALLVVDLGSLFYTKRHLQSVADTTALSAVNNLNSANAIALNTASLNAFQVPGEHGNTLQAITGRYDSLTRSFASGAALTEHNAVQVNVSSQQPYFFMLGSREVTATATATREDIAGLSVGSGLLNINTQHSALLNGILGQLLNTSLNLSAAFYQGLANASIRLIDLVRADASVGTVQELLETEIGVGDLLDLTATALSRSDIAAVDARIIQSLRLLALDIPGDLTLRLGDLIDTSLAPGDAAATAEINVLQLITLSAQVAKRDHFLNVPVLGLDLPGLVTLNLALSLIETPSLAIGPPGQDAQGNWRTRAHTAQLRLKLDLVVGELLGGLLRVPLYLETAAGDAWLKSIDCRSPRENSVVTIGANSSAVRAYVGNVNPEAMTDRTATATVTEATILNVLGLVKVNARAEANLPGGGGDLEFTGPFNGQNSQTISGLATAGLISGLSDSKRLNLDVELLGIGLGLDEVLSPLLNLLTPVFQALDGLLAPVLSILGIQLGYADITAFHLTCGAPRLVR
ncbi:MAG: hypothetical protein IPG66_15200 [Hydrogenophilales bacterium]|nr:hypothetical protein [Hydrogenophilales bacterium]